jgi:hypothetical protein
MTPEISRTQILMSQLVIGPLCLLFRVRIFADTKHGWAIENFP